MITPDSLAEAVPGASNVSVNGSVAARATATGTAVFEGVRASAYPVLFCPPFFSYGSSIPALKKVVKTNYKIYMCFFRMGFLLHALFRFIPSILFKAKKSMRLRALLLTNLSQLFKAA